MIVFSDQLTRVQLEEACDFLEHHCNFVNAVQVVVQLGSGATVEGLLDEIYSRFPLQEMPHMPTEDSAARHRLQVCWGRIGEVKALVFCGRFHLYEGYGRLPCLLPVWAAASCGARCFVLTNAAGAVNPALPTGSLMAIRDHINNLGESALSGHQHLLGDPFVDMTGVYRPELCESLLATGKRLAMPVGEGVYMANRGPQFETPAEVRMAAALGADAVGMSTVLEATLAHALGVQVLGISMITNAAAGLAQAPITHGEHLQVGGQVGPKLTQLIREWVLHEGHGYL